MGTRHVPSAVLTVTLTVTVLTTTALTAACGGAAREVTTQLAAPAPTSAAAGVPLGSEVTVDGFPGAIGSITVSDADHWTRSARPLSDPPREGAYVRVKLSARSIGTQPFDLYPFDFYLADAQGHRYE
jgi:hypothetical protein